MCGGAQITLDPDSLLVEKTQLGLRGHESLLRGEVEPRTRGHRIAVCSYPVKVKGTHLGLREGKPPGSREEETLKSLHEVLIDAAPLLVVDPDVVDGR